MYRLEMGIAEHGVMWNTHNLLAFRTVGVGTHAHLTHVTSKYNMLVFQQWKVNETKYCHNYTHKIISNDTFCTCTCIFQLWQNDSSPLLHSSGSQGVVAGIKHELYSWCNSKYGLVLNYMHVFRNTLTNTGKPGRTCTLNYDAYEQLQLPTVLV